MSKKTKNIEDVDPQIPLAEAVAHFGNQSELARFLGLERATVSGWKGDEFIPPLHAYRLVRKLPNQFGDMSPAA